MVKKKSRAENKRQASSQLADHRRDLRRHHRPDRLLHRGDKVHKDPQEEEEESKPPDRRAQRQAA